MNLHSRTEMKIKNLSPLVRILLRLEKVQLTVYFIENYDFKDCCIPMILL